MPAKVHLVCIKAVSVNKIIGRQNTKNELVVEKNIESA